MRIVSGVILLSVIASAISCAGTSDITSNTGPDQSRISNSTAVPAGSNTPSSNYSNTAAQPESFWTAAADGGLAEVVMGKIAARKSQDPEVKKFAQMMVRDHSKANNELAALAAKQKITLPTDIGPRNKSTIDELNRLTGADFDREYVQAMVDDHETDIQLFEDQADDELDTRAKAFAAKTLPVLRRHLEAIKAIQAKMH